MRIPVAVALVTSIAVVPAICRAHAASQVTVYGMPAEVPSALRPLFQGVITEDQAAEIRAALPYDQISLEKTGGMMVPGGRFRLTLSRDGSAALWCESGVFGRVGDAVGTVSLFDLGKVSLLIDQAGLDRFSGRYASAWTDMQTLTLTVANSQKTVTVADYGGAGPVSLWSIQAAIKAIGWTIAWKQK